MLGVSFCINREGKMELRKFGNEPVEIVGTFKDEVRKFIGI